MEDNSIWEQHLLRIEVKMRIFIFYLFFNNITHLHQPLYGGVIDSTGSSQQASLT